MTDKEAARGQREFLIPFLLYGVGALVFFRWQIFSGFDLVFGDRGDGRLISFIHEHVFRSLVGAAAFLSPPYFFNETHTLGYSDALLLDQIFYTPLRLLGADALLALSLTEMALSAIAYLFSYLLMRRLAVAVPLAAFAALLVTFPNNLYVKCVHSVFFSVYFIPVIAYCGVVAVAELQRRPARAYLVGAIGGGLYGLLFATGYYMAWFFGAALLIFCPLMATVAWRPARDWWKCGPHRVVGLAAAAGISFMIALVPFFVIYLPVLAAGDRRDFSEYLKYGASLRDIINVGNGNLVWSGLIRSWKLLDGRHLHNVEVYLALTPIIQLLLFGCLVLALYPQVWPRTQAGRLRRAFVLAGPIVFATFFVLTVKHGESYLVQIPARGGAGGVGDPRRISINVGGRPVRRRCDSAGGRPGVSPLPAPAGALPTLYAARWPDRTIDPRNRRADQSHSEFSALTRV